MTKGRQYVPTGPRTSQARVCLRACSTTASCAVVRARRPQTTAPHLASAITTASRQASPPLRRARHSPTRQRPTAQTFRNGNGLEVAQQWRLQRRQQQHYLFFLGYLACTKEFMSTNGTKSSGNPSPGAGTFCQMPCTLRNWVTAWAPRGACAERGMRTCERT